MSVHFKKSVLVGVKVLYPGSEWSCLATHILVAELFNKRQDSECRLPGSLKGFLLCLSENGQK